MLHYYVVLLTNFVFQQNEECFAKEVKHVNIAIYAIPISTTPCQSYF